MGKKLVSKIGKTAIYLVIVTSAFLFLESCKKDQNKTMEPSDPVKKTANRAAMSVPAYCDDLENPCTDPACRPYYDCEEDDNILDEISQSTDYQNYVTNFQSSLGALDFTKANYIQTDTGNYVTIPSFSKVGTSNVPKSVFAFTYDDSTLGKGLVYDYSRAIITNGSYFSSGDYRVSFPNGWELCIVEKKPNGTFEMRDGEDITTIDAYISSNLAARALSVEQPCYYTYVRNCYNAGKIACENDPNCRFYCDFLPCASLRLTDCSLKGLRMCKIFGHG